MRILWREWRWDLLTLAGIVCVVIGIRQIYPPAAWIVGGALAGGIGLIGFFKNKRVEG